MNRAQQLSHFFPVLISASLLWGAFLFPSFRFLTFFALVPWLLQIYYLDSKRATRSGFVFGFLYYLGQMSWLYPFLYKWTGNGFLPLIPLLLLALLGSAYFSLQGWLIWRCYTAKMPLMIPFAWAAVEIFRAYCPMLAFPWGLIATPLSGYPQIIQHAALGSIFLVSAWVVLVNLIVVLIFLRQGKKSILTSSSVVLVFLFYSLYRYTHPPLTEVKRKVMLGQIGVDMAFTPLDLMHKEIREALDRIFTIAKKEKPDLLILPEGLTHGGDTIPPHTPFPYLPPVPTVFGGIRGTDPAYQSAFAYSDDSWQYEDKTRLVAFGEYVPFRKYLPFLKDFKLPSGDLTPGKKVKAFRMDRIVVGPILCFEALFPDIAYRQTLNGANLLAVMAIDDFYMGTTAIQQLKETAIWRAVESGLPLGRCGSQGVTLAVDARGNILKEAPIKIFDPMTVTIKLPESSDAFVYRDMFSWLAGLATFWVLLAPSLRRKSS